MLFGCWFGETAFICGTGGFNTVKEIVFNLPIGLAVAPPFIFWFPKNVIGASSALQIYMHPAMVYMGTLDVILVLAIVHLVGTGASFFVRIARRPRN